MKEKSYKFDLFHSKDVRDRVRCLNSYSVLSGITIDVPVTIEGTQNWAESLSGRHGRKDLVLRDEQGQAVAFSGLVNISHKNGDRKSTRLNSSHVAISYAVFCLKQKNTLSA